MRRGLPAAAGAALLLAASPVRAQQLVADLTEHFVAITAGFTGASVTLFGSSETEGDIVITVRGPKRDTVVRRKAHMAGIWLNNRHVTFAGVPGYYAALSSRPIEDLLPEAQRKLNGIGLDALRLPPVGDDLPPDIESYKSAMLDEFLRTGLYTTRIGAITFLGKHLFRATLSLPASVPTGAYSIEVFLIRRNEIAATETIPLVIEQTGFEATVNDVAEAHSLAYGVVAVLLAAMAGYLASFLFRSAR
jgi:uncharacterized protein (TIGR02186 family)